MSSPTWEDVFADASQYEVTIEQIKAAVVTQREAD